MITSEQVNALSKVPMDALMHCQLTDLATIEVDAKLPREFRILRFIEDAGNPYCLKVGDHYVRTRFTSSGPTLQNALAKLIQQT